MKTETLKITVHRIATTGRYEVDTNHGPGYGCGHTACDGDPRLAVLDAVQGWLTRVSQDAFDEEQAERKAAGCFGPGPTDPTAD